MIYAPALPNDANIPNILMYTAGRAASARYAIYLQDDHIASKKSQTIGRELFQAFGYRCVRKTFVLSLVLSIYGPRLHSKSQDMDGDMDSIQNDLYILRLGPAFFKP